MTAIRGITRRKRTCQYLLIVHRKNRLKTIKAARPGYCITVGDHFGRITTMDLMHTEIQTEERDLTTLPNTYLVSNPVRVMRTSGTLLYVELSLGYDISRREIEELLLAAATETGLESPFVQIRDLGDFSVTYRISGLLTDVNRLIDKRRELRARTMDGLHAAKIEIVSPSFMNTRVYESSEQFVPELVVGADPIDPDMSTDALIFGKAGKPSRSRSSVKGWTRPGNDWPPASKRSRTRANRTTPTRKSTVWKNGLCA